MIHDRVGLSTRRRFLRSLPRPPIKSGWIFGSSILSTPPPPHRQQTHPLLPLDGPANHSQGLQPLRHPLVHEQQCSEPSPAPYGAVQIPAPDPIIHLPVHHGHSCSYADPEAVIVHLRHHPFPGAQTTHPLGECSAAVCRRPPETEADLLHLAARPIFPRAGGDSIEEEVDASFGSRSPRP